MTYQFDWKTLPNQNQTCNIETTNVIHIIEKHISDCDEKGPYYSIQSYQKQSNKQIATNVTFGNTETELCSVLNKILERK